MVSDRKKLSEEEKEKRNRRKAKLYKHNLKIAPTEPITDNQSTAFHSYFQGKNVFLHGVAGTGKSFIAMYFALSEIMSGRAEKIVIIRSTVQTREMGFMPGSEEEKLAYYETPYKQLCAQLLSRDTSYNLLKEKGAIEFCSTAFMRGVTIDNSVIIIDEVQNMNFHEIDSILTRIGENSRLIICGDFRQSDLNVVGRKNDKSGIEKLITICEKMPSIDMIEFTAEDIVRSGFVKEYILTKIDLDYD